MTDRELTGAEAIAALGNVMRQRPVSAEATGAGRMTTKEEPMRASAPSDAGERQDLRARNQKAPCRVKGCIADADEPSSWPRTVITIGVCRWHQSLSDVDLRELLRRGAGLLEPMEPITDRIEYEQACGCWHNTREFTKRCAQHSQA